MKPETKSAQVRSKKDANLMVRLDPTAKRLVQKVASLRGVSTSDYVRSVVLANARRDLVESERNVLALTAEEQSAFWAALNVEVVLTPAKRRLAALMRGKKRA